MGSWSKAYEFGIPKIDTQHKKLFEIYDSIPNNKIDNILNDVEQYAIHHFNTEERYFGELEESLFLSKEEIEEHIKEHNEMKLKVIEWRKQHNIGKLDINEVSKFLKDWLIRHIMITDAKYVPYLKKIIK